MYIMHRTGITAGGKTLQISIYVLLFCLYEYHNQGLIITRSEKK